VDFSSAPAAVATSVPSSPLPTDASSPPIDARPRTQLQAGIRKPKVYTDGTIRYGCYTSTSEPSNLDEALRDKKWHDAMDIEYEALMKNKTWHLVPPQKGRNVIDCRWVWKVKKKGRW
jgi:hypothetical protein